MSVVDISSREFDYFISNPKTVVDFSAEWCGPCHALAPVLDKISQDKKEVSFAKVDIDDNHELASRFKIKSIPCLIVFKKGVEVGRIVGNSTALATKLSKILDDD